MIMIIINNNNDNNNDNNNNINIYIYITYPLKSPEIPIVVGYTTTTQSHTWRL